MNRHPHDDKTEECQEPLPIWGIRIDHPIGLNTNYLKRKGKLPKKRRLMLFVQCTNPAAILNS